MLNFLFIYYFAHICFKGQGLEFDMKYQTLYDLRTSTPFKEKSSHRFKNIHKLRLMTNILVNLTLSPRGVMN